MTALTIQGVIGPGVVCMWLSFILYGLILAQVYFYFSAYHDHILIRLTVVLVCALEGLQVAVLIHMMYTYLVVNFGDSEKTLTIIWSACVAVYLEVTIGVVVQSYYIWRIWMLNRNIFAVGYLVLVLLTRLIFGYWANTFVSIKGKWATLGASEGYVRIGSTGQSAGVLLDVSITSILLFSLYKSQGLALTRVTRNIVQKLMFYILGSGILTAIISVLSLILFVAFRTDIHYGGTLIILTKVYANSMLAMLNGRQGIRRDASRDNGYSVQLSDLTNSRMVFASPKTNAAQAEGAGEIRGTDDNWFSQGASTKGISCESNESPDPTVAAV